MNWKRYAEKALVTFVEAAVAYVIVIPTVNWDKTVIAGAIGAGLSAVYNVVRESTPTAVTEVPISVASTPPLVTAGPIAPESSTPVVSP